MSDTASSQAGLFGGEINARERAAHIACAVVLTIVVLSVIVALIVYFTAGPSITIKGGDCDASDASMSNADTQVRRTDTQVKKVEVAPKKVEVAPKQKVEAPKKKVERAAASKQATRLNAAAPQTATSFQADSGLASAVTANAGSTIRQAQGVTVNSRMENYTGHLANFAKNYQGALATQNPVMARLQDTPNSMHSKYAGYQGDLSTPHLKQEYVDSTLFPKVLKEWQKQPTMRHNRSEDYNRAVIRNQGVTVHGARI